MAYNLTTGAGTIITIADGTIDTTSTSLALPGRNYSGYGQPVDQDLIRLMEHFASPNIPTKPLPGQIWFDTTGAPTSPGTLKLYPTNGATSGWINIMTNPVNEDLVVNGNITVANNAGVAGNLTVGGLIYGAMASNVQFAAGGTANGGGASGVDYNGFAYVKVSYNTVGAAVAGNTTNYYAAGICNPANVTGMNPSTGSIYGSWTLAAGSTLNATYADLAERFEADTVYEAGTVVELGGEREITAVREELSDRVFGVVSKSAAFMMNSHAGSDATHPAVAVGGRVPVKVIGTVRKGDRLVSAGNGYARSAKEREAGAFNTIGRALKNKDTEGLGTVEAFVSIK
jgi:hypothetical protein